jgi:hypothetical protein
MIGTIATQIKWWSWALLINLALPKSTYVEIYFIQDDGKIYRQKSVIHHTKTVQDP